MDSGHYPQGPARYYAGPHGDERIYHPGYPHPGQPAEMHSPNTAHYQGSGYAPVTAHASNGHGGYAYVPAPGPGYHPAQYGQTSTPAGTVNR